MKGAIACTIGAVFEGSLATAKAESTVDWLLPWRTIAMPPTTT